MKKAIYLTWVLITIQILIFISWFNYINYQTQKHLPKCKPVETIEKDYYFKNDTTTKEITP